MACRMPWYSAKRFSYCWIEGPRRPSPRASAFSAADTEPETWRAPYRAIVRIMGCRPWMLAPRRTHHRLRFAGAWHTLRGEAEPHLVFGFRDNSVRTKDGRRISRTLRPISA